MNTPNPLIPQGTFNQSARGASNLRVAVVTIAAIHVVFFGGLLLQGCKRDPKTDAANNTATNAEPASASTTAATGSSSYGPIDPTNTLYYSSPSNLPTDSGASTASTASTATTGTRPTETPFTGLTTNNVDSGLTTPSTLPTTTAETRDYTVVRNDSFFKIAKQHGVTVAALTRANPTIDASRLKVGTKLKVPAPESVTARQSTSANGSSVESGNSYVVKSGDTLTKIATAHGVSVSELRSANGLKTSRLNVGQKLKIPAKASSAAGTTNTGPSPLR